MMRVRIKIGNAAVPWRWNMDEGVPFFTSLLWLTSRLADVAAFPGLECQFLGQFIYIPVPKCYGMSTTKAFSFLLYFSSHSLTSSKLGTIYILFKKFSKFFFPCRNNVRLAYPIFFSIFINVGGHWSPLHAWHWVHGLEQSECWWMGVIWGDRWKRSCSAKLWILDYVLITEEVLIPEDIMQEDATLS